MTCGVRKCQSTRTSVGVALAEDMMTYKDLVTLAPDDQLYILRAKHSLEGIDCGVDEGPERG